MYLAPAWVMFISSSHLNAEERDSVLRTVFSPDHRFVHGHNIQNHISVCLRFKKKKCLSVWWLVCIVEQCSTGAYVSLIALVYNFRHQRLHGWLTAFGVREHCVCFILWCTSFFLFSFCGNSAACSYFESSSCTFMTHPPTPQNFR